MIGLNVIATLCAACFMFGSVTGAVVTYRFYNYNAMQKTISVLREANKKYEEAIGVSKNIDSAGDEVEFSNDEVMAAINEKIRAEAEKIKGKQDDCAGQVDKKRSDKFICVPPDILRAIGGLK